MAHVELRHPPPPFRIAFTVPFVRRSGTLVTGTIIRQYGWNTKLAEQKRRYDLVGECLLRSCALLPGYLLAAGPLLALYQSDEILLITV